jgi:hypothetical protein
MSGQTKVGNLATAFPIAKAVGALHSVPTGTAAAAPAVAVPPPSPLAINGKTVIIDVRTMSGSDIVNLLNGIPGITASIDGSSRLVVAGITMIDGNPNLRALLGI